VQQTGGADIIDENFADVLHLGTVLVAQDTQQVGNVGRAGVARELLLQGGFGRPRPPQLVKVLAGCFEKFADESYRCNVHGLKSAALSTHTSNAWMPHKSCDIVMVVETDILRYFQHVADGATVTEVAELYQVSQPGVSRGLKRLDDEVGTPLLHRSGRLLKTTHAGHVFKRHVDAVLHALDDGLAAAEELIDPEAGTVRVAFQLSLGTWLVPHLVAAFRQTHPGIRFELEPSLDALGSSPVATGRTDLEFTTRRSGHPEVHWEWLFNQPLCLAVPPDHQLADRKRIALADVATEDFVMLRSTWELRSRSDELCTRAGFVPQVRFEADDLPVVLGFVAAGLGVAIVPAVTSEVQAPGSRERLVRLTDPAAYREVGLAWPADRRLLPSADLFRRHVVDDTRASRREPR